MAKDQNLTRDSIEKYSQRISDQVGTALTGEMARNQKLNNNLQETQAAAADALKLNHELTALYLSTFKDEGIVTRLLMLPADVVKDAVELQHHHQQRPQEGRAGPGQQGERRSRSAWPTSRPRTRRAEPAGTAA